MNKFTLGAMTGMASLALAVPILAQVSAAQTTDSGVSAAWTKPPHELSATVENVQEMITRDNAFLSHINEIVSIQKSAKEAHLAALTAAASMTDDTQRADAVRAAHEAERTAMKNAMETNPDLKDAMMPMIFGGHGRHGRGPDSAKLAEKKGITLPAPPQGPWGRHMMDDDAASSPFAQ